MANSRREKEREKGRKGVVKGEEGVKGTEHGRKAPPPPINFC